jgi:hypothetical protein
MQANTRLLVRGLAQQRVGTMTKISPIGRKVRAIAGQIEAGIAAFFKKQFIGQINLQKNVSTREIHPALAENPQAEVDLA